MSEILRCGVISGVFVKDSLILREEIGEYRKKVNYKVQEWQDKVKDMARARLPWKTELGASNTPFSVST